MKEKATAILGYLTGAILALAFLFSSCSVHKKVSKEKKETTVATETNSVSTSSAVATETTTKKYEKDVIVPADSIKDVVKTGELDNGKVKIMEDDDLKTTLSKDDKGNISVKTEKKEKKVAVPVEETTVKNMTTTGAATVAEKENIVVSEEKSNKDVERTGGLNLNYLWLIAVALYLVADWKFKILIFRKTKSDSDAVS